MQLIADVESIRARLEAELLSSAKEFEMQMHSLDIQIQVAEHEESMLADDGGSKMTAKIAELKKELSIERKK
jgi:hypothetical protein